MPTPSSAALPADPLPVLALLPALREALDGAGMAVLEAPPGAGKTTGIPLALLDAPWLGAQRIIMLEPRRLAARAAARRMSEVLGEPVGTRVGYRTRLESRVSAATRIEVVTEGILTRLLQEDPALEGVGLVIFDEYHERSLVADLGLALVLESRAALREELRLLVMSATLDGAAVAALLGGAPVLRSEGRSFPVETRHRPPRPEQPFEAAVAGVVREALATDEGDLLVFLPGAREIRRVEERLAERELPAGVRVLPLHGDFSPEAQDAALAPARPGERKVVLSTNVAETSLTIGGVRIVVDGGRARLARFSPRTGMTRLETVRVTRASADQRRGRAGRTAPGVCYRLWAAHDDLTLLPSPRPEILDADLAPLALDLAVAGVRDPATLRWLDPPPAAAFQQARDLLTQLGALDTRGALTSHGRAMAGLGTHPRLAHLMLRGHALGLGRAAAALAALLEERDLLQRDGGPAESDLRHRLELVLGEGGRGAPAGHRVRHDALRRVREQAARWTRLLKAPPLAAADALAAAGRLAAIAYPERVGRRRDGGAPRWLLRSGQGAVLDRHDALATEEFLVAVELDGDPREARIFLAAPLAREEMTAEFAEAIVRERVVGWDTGAREVVAAERERLGAIVLAERPLRDLEPAERIAAALDGVRREGLALLPWTDGAERLRARLAFLHAIDASWPDMTDEALLATLDLWLAPMLSGRGRRAGLDEVDVHGALLALLPWPQRSALDRLAPTHVEVPTGSRIAVDYTDPASPVLAVRLQELFGLTETPTVADGRVPLTMHLLSPGYRPVQVTRDLASFWRNAYFEVRKDLRARYPKHAWPEDPMTAKPVRKGRS